MDEFDYVPGLVPSPFASSAAPKLDRDDSFREIEISVGEVTAEIKEAQAENVRLHSELSSMLSADKVRNYAVSVLGMQKIERYQIHYFESRSGNTVVVADGKSMTPGA